MREQTLPRIGLAINNNLLKYYKKFLSGKKSVRIFSIKSIGYKIQKFFLTNCFYYRYQFRPGPKAKAKKREILDDKDLLRRMSGAHLTRMYRRLQPYIKKMQEKQKSAYVEFEQLIQYFQTIKESEKHQRRLNRSLPAGQFRLSFSL